MCACDARRTTGCVLHQASTGQGPPLLHRVFAAHAIRKLRSFAPPKSRNFGGWVCGYTCVPVTRHTVAPAMPQGPRQCTTAPCHPSRRLRWRSWHGAMTLHHRGVGLASIQGPAPASCAPWGCAGWWWQPCWVRVWCGWAWQRRGARD